MLPYATHLAIPVHERPRRALRLLLVELLVRRHKLEVAVHEHWEENSTELSLHTGKDLLLPTMHPTTLAQRLRETAAWAPSRLEHVQTSVHPVPKALVLIHVQLRVANHLVLLVQQGEHQVVCHLLRGVIRFGNHREHLPLALFHELVGETLCVCARAARGEFLHQVAGDEQLDGPSVPGRGWLPLRSLLRRSRRRLLVLRRLLLNSTLLLGLLG